MISDILSYCSCVPAGSAKQFQKPHQILQRISPHIHTLAAPAPSTPSPNIWPQKSRSPLGQFSSQNMLSPTPPSTNPNLRQSRTESPLNSHRTINDTSPSRSSIFQRQRARSSSFEPQTLEGAKQTLDNLHSRAEEFSNMLDLLMQVSYRAGFGPRAIRPRHRLPPNM